MSSVFKFKQFNVNQAGTTMKINTDGVLLAAMVHGMLHGGILDVGTGTGVIALMLAQRFPEAAVEAIEPDSMAFGLSRENFAKSPFSERLMVQQSYLSAYDTKAKNYGLIVSNPPFFLQSLKNPDARKSLARHGNIGFFECLMEKSALGLHAEGMLQIIVPCLIAPAIIELAGQYGLHLARRIQISSFSHSEPFRSILVFALKNSDALPSKELFVIYKDKGIYTLAYHCLLKDFFLNF